MWQYNYTPSSDELYHHGIKGMRWGVRRYKNKDGSLTSAGKKRYKSDAEKNPSEKKTGSEKTVKKHVSGKKVAAVAGLAVVGVGAAAVTKTLISYNKLINFAADFSKLG